MEDNLLKKFLTFSYGSGIGLIIGFFTTMVTTRILDPEDFGKASMFTLAINVCTIFIIFGHDQSFVRFFYEEKEEKRGGLLYNCLKIPIIIAVIISLLILFFSKQISLFLFEEKNLKIIFILIFGMIIQILYRYGVLVIRMQKKGNLFSLLEILNRLSQFAIIIILFFFIGPSYEIIIYSTVITLSVLAVVSIMFAKKFWHYRNISLENLKHSKAGILNYSYPLVLTTLITWLFESFDKVAIRNWSDFQELGLYAAAFKIVALLSVIQVAFSTFWSPICYEKFEADPEDRTFYEHISTIVAFSMFIVAIVTIAFKDIIIMLLGQEYGEAGKIIPFLVFMPIMYTLSETTVIGINFYKKPKWHILIAGIVCVVNIVGNSILVPPYGATGAAISTALSYIIFFGLRTYVSLKYYKVNYKLKKVYFVIFTILLYGFYSLHNETLLGSILVGFIFFSIVIIVYFRDLLNLYRNYKNI
ncbi:lipopolysaccharide biosynthesis protein [Priestia abyssalis]|uniref:lipopolysaccharide biosynthesis protein n=1 Tax=Priestia abyssalis TaxID=1221450 RepID=UPI000995A35B|nr:oligosaccharide flippase family protein [Priestia abyssalis]